MAAWAAWPEDEPGEFVDGHRVDEEVPSLEHELLVVWLIRILGNWLTSGSGFVFGSEAKFAVSPTRGRKPDLSAYLPGRSPGPARGAVEVPPDIVVEIVSPTPRDGRRDRVEKMVEYAGFGVRFYWIVEPGLRTFEVYELGSDGRYIHAVGATTGVLDDIPGCVGLSLDLDAMWSELDRLAVDDG